LLVTGASGFLGSEIVRQAVERGWQVRALSHQRQPPIHLPVEVCRGDIRDSDAVKTAIAGCDAIIHAAGLAHQHRLPADPANRFDSVNAHGAQGVAAAAATIGTPRFVFLSSVSVYGSSEGRPDERTPCAPTTPYGQSKLRGEQLTTRAAESSRMQLCILRLATVYGEDDPGNLLRLIRALHHGRFLWIGEGSNRKSLIHREDVARACLLAAERNVPGAQTFNVTGPPSTMATIVRTIAAELGREVPALRVPSSVGWGLVRLGRQQFVPSRLAHLSNSIEKWLKHDDYDGTAFDTAFEFRPAIDLATGLGREVRWYRQMTDAT
jgi:nucleoside-diphosphate-sugar epimerase